MTMARRGWTKAVLMVGALVLLVGCDDVTEPQDFTSIKDEADFSATSSEVDDVLTRAVRSATAAVDGRDLDGADAATTTTCGEVHPKRFRQLESLGSFLGTADSAEGATELIRAAWEAEGWAVEAVAADAVNLTGTTSTGVGFSMFAELRRSDNDPSTVVVSLSLTSDCLELPDEALVDP